MRREELYLADLIDNARAVRGYLDGVTRERWDARAAYQVGAGCRLQRVLMACQERLPVPEIR